MGNMSNPVINRVGVNQFWYNHWYSNSSYSLNVKQDLNFNSLLSKYIDYGSSYNNNTFIHEYWYKKNLKKPRLYPISNFMQFYKRVYFSHSILGIEHSYLIRHKTQEYFPMRAWTLKYNNWYVISLFWFKPNKLKTKQKQYQALKNSFGGVVSKNVKKTNANLPSIKVYMHQKLGKALLPSYSF